MVRDAHLRVFLCPYFAAAGCGIFSWCVVVLVFRCVLAYDLGLVNTRRTSLGDSRECRFSLTAM